MTQDEIIEMARQVCDVTADSRGRESFDFDSYGLKAFAKLIAEAAASKEREHWKEIVDGQLRCITALNDIVGGEGSTTTKNILDYSRMEERIKEAVLEERDACAKVCGRLADEALVVGDEDAVMCFEEAENAIRARGEA